VADVWWLTIRTPRDVRCWPLGNPDPSALDDLIARAKALVSFPGGDSWAADPAGPWHCAYGLGEPHPNVGAQVRDVAELRAVSPGAVVAWREADVQARRAADLAAARAATARLTDADRATLRAELAGATTPKPTGGR